MTTFLHESVSAWTELVPLARVLTFPPGNVTLNCGSFRLIFSKTTNSCAALLTQETTCHWTELSGRLCLRRNSQWNKFRFTHPDSQVTPMVLVKRSHRRIPHQIINEVVQDTRRDANRDPVRSRNRDLEAEAAAAAAAAVVVVVCGSRDSSRCRRRATRSEEKSHSNGGAARRGHDATESQKWLDTTPTLCHFLCRIHM